jgi:hypothetical protein
MSGLIVIAVAGLLLQEVTPHPSTRSAYQAPVIRPFEPGRDLEPARAQGEAEATPYRRPLPGPVTVDAYVRSYEFAPTDIESAYEQGVAAAETRADQTAGRLDGVWRLVDAGGETLYELVLNDPGTGIIEGGWRGRGGAGAATSDGASLSLDGAGTVALEPSGTGWRGRLTLDGRDRVVRLIRPD